jgi:hypothetical protein
MVSRWRRKACSEARGNHECWTQKGRRSKPHVFISDDVLFSGAAGPSEHSASLLTLRMAEISLSEDVTSQQMIAEAERSPAEKLPQMRPAFRPLLARCLRVVPEAGLELNGRGKDVRLIPLPGQDDRQMVPGQSQGDNMCDV